ncbi:MAG: Stp1/IreP family PP2C-type Ser/Thr phosphatase [Acetobacteraceae bacterium]
MSAESPSLQIVGAMLSHQGCVRTNNEDSVCYVMPRKGDAAADRGVLAIVADGMGGEAAGEVASQIAIDTLQTLYYEMDGSVPDALAASLAAANDAVYRHSRSDKACAGMGTTCTAIVVRDGELFLGHVGDSRAYMMRGGALHQISVDHSLVAALVRDGTLTAEQAAASPDRNVILQALGTRETVDPFLFKEGLPLQPGDVIVLCSDGLSDLVADPRIAEIVAGIPPLDACQTLIDAALAAGGHDNVSVGVFAVTDQLPDAAAAERPTREINVTREIFLRDDAT